MMSTATTNEPALLTHLRVLHRRWRTVTWRRGLAANAAAAIAMLLGGCVIDNSIVLAFPARCALTVCLYAGIAICAWRQWLRHWLRPFDAQRVAWLVEGVRPELREKVISSIEFRRHRDAHMSAAMIARLLAEAEADVRNIRPETAFPFDHRHLRLPVALLAVFLSAWGVPQLHLRERLARVAFPSPRDADVGPFALAVLAPQTTPAAEGDDVRFSVLCAAAAARPELVLGDPPRRRLPMLPRGPAGHYTCVAANVRDSFVYRAEADGVRSRRYRVTVVERPRLERFTVACRFPAFSRLSPSVVETTAPDIRALRGTQVTLTAAASKPLATFGLRYNGKAVAGNVSPDGRSAVARFVVATTGSFTIDATDRQGRAPLGGTTFSIEAVADQRPVVVLTAPAGDLYRSANEAVKLRWNSHDDFGLASQELRVVINRGEPLRTVALAGDTRAYRLAMRTLAIHPGDVVDVQISARDANGNDGASAWLHIQVAAGHRLRNADEFLAGVGALDRALERADQLLQAAVELTRALASMQHDGPADTVHYKALRNQRADAFRRELILAQLRAEKLGGLSVFPPATCRTSTASTAEPPERRHFSTRFAGICPTSAPPQAESGTRRSVFSSRSPKSDRLPGDAYARWLADYIRQERLFADTALDQDRAADTADQLATLIRLGRKMTGLLADKARQNVARLSTPLYLRQAKKLQEDLGNKRNREQLEDLLRRALQSSRAMRSRTARALSQVAVPAADGLAPGLRGRYFARRNAYADPNDDGAAFERLNQYIEYPDAAAFDLGPPPYAVVWTGVIRVEERGMYRFLTTSDDGSELLVDGRVVVDNNGSHDPRTRSGAVVLQPGDHAVELHYCNIAGFGQIVAHLIPPKGRRRVLGAPLLRARPIRGPGDIEPLLRQLLDDAAKMAADDRDLDRCANEIRQRLRGAPALLAGMAEDLRRHHRDDDWVAVSRVAAAFARIARRRENGPDRRDAELLAVALTQAARKHQPETVATAARALPRLDRVRDRRLVTARLHEALTHAAGQIPQIRRQARKNTSEPAGQRYAEAVAADLGELAGATDRGMATGDNDAFNHVTAAIAAAHSHMVATGQALARRQLPQANGRLDQADAALTDAITELNRRLATAEQARTRARQSLETRLQPLDPAVTAAAVPAVSPTAAPQVDQSENRNMPNTGDRRDRQSQYSNYYREANRRYLESVAAENRKWMHTNIR